ncbi:MAG: amidohydrolase [Thermoplasmatota archaeon]
MNLKIEDAKIISREGRWDLLIDEGEIKEIGKELGDADECIQAEGKFLMPGFVNTHTHAAMSLLRGYADDLPLQTWLEKKIWPVEGNLDEDYIYWGTKLACLEMIKTGTIAFNDMYFFMESAAEAVEDMGMKAVLSYGMIDLDIVEKREDEIEKTKEFMDEIKDSELVKAALGPHSLYTLSREGLEWCAEYSKEKDLLVHFHLGETEKELSDFKEEHDGTMTGYLDDIGILNDRMIAAHCVWLEEKDFELLGERGVVVSHNPTSNMKLGVGKPMDYEKLAENGVLVTLGTDGCASNNNLDMLEEAKIAALQQKMSGDPTSLPAERAYEMITKNGAGALKTGGGVVEEGKAADLILVERGVQSVPGHNLVSDLVYSMNGLNITDVIINGVVVMKDRYVEGEEEIMDTAREKAAELVSEVE